MQTPKQEQLVIRTKVDAKTNAPLEGAEFQIVGARTVASKVTGIKFTEDAQGTYYKLATGAYTTTAPTDATAARYDTAASGKKYKKESFTEVKTETQDVKVSAISGADGIIKFDELGAGQYTITELLAPDGYNALEDPIVFTITYTAPTGEPAEGTETCTWDKTGVSGVDGDKVVFDSASGLFKVTIGNNSGTTLPSTGGIGTTIFYVLGAILVLGGTVVLVTRRRMAA